MSFAPMDTPSLLGEVTEKECGNYFHYDFSDGFFGAEYPHRIYVGAGGTRYARILKTVAYVVVDEVNDAPVVEKWNLKKHIVF